jgi:hypothetical protein
MSLVTCAECKAQISRRAKKCIHCGAPIKPKLHEVLIGLSVLALIVIGIGKCVANRPPRDPERDRALYCAASGRSMAYLYAQDFITERLRAPSTASYPSYSARGVDVHWVFGCKFTIKGYVDAENAFGAKIRSGFLITMEYSPENDRWYGSGISIASY